LGIVLDWRLILRNHYMACLQKAWGIEIGLRTLCRANGLTLDLVRRL
jgi:hypothetical protein